ncbi:hypothetical protein K488DRAFT_60336, partial [Vararia minispora EC-137]
MCTAVLKRLRDVDALLSADQASTSLYAKLLDDADFLQEHVSEFRTCANSYAPVFRLPPEILREIATILSQIWVPNVPHCIYTLRPPCLGWVVLSHVCKRFRAVLLGHRSLWAQTISVFPSAQDEFLRRAGACPISFSISK